MSWRRRRWLERVGPTLVLVLMACHRGPSGRWALVSVDGAPVPTSIAPFENDTLWLYAGSIEFRGGDTALRAERTAGWRQVDPGRTSVWRYRVTGDSIVLWADCAPDRICPGQEFGVITDDSLVVRSSRFADVRLQYHRVSGTRP